MEENQPVGNGVEKQDSIKALIDAPTLHKIERFAQSEGRKLGDVLTEAIIEYLEQHNRY